MDRYSIMNTKVRRVDIGHEVFVEKQIKPNVNLSMPLESLKAMIDAYLEHIEQSGIRMPKLCKAYIEKDHLVYITEYKGECVLELFPDYSFFEGIGSVVLHDVLQLLKKAKQFNIYLDPHPSNFVWDGKLIYFVDFLPPFSETYNELRMKFAKDEQKSLIECGLAQYKSENVFYHFVACFFTVVKYIPEDFLRDLYNVIVAEKCISSSYESYMKRIDGFKKTKEMLREYNVQLF